MIIGFPTWRRQKKNSHDSDASSLPSPISSQTLRQAERNIRDFQTLVETNPKAAEWLIGFCTRYIDRHLP